MSDLTGLVAISALAVTSTFLILHVTRMINDLGDQIVTGFIRDHPIPATQRWLMLYSRWVAYVAVAVGVPLFLALAAAMMADHVGDADSRLLGYVAAFLLVIGGINWLIQGIVQFISYRSLLREAESN
jgi:hypothetical protein